MNIASQRVTADRPFEPAADIAPASADPLADALLYLAAHHGRALSREALIAGLPVEEGRLNVALFDRAAQRAGLETEAVKRSLSDIPTVVLPAVRRFCVAELLVRLRPSRT